MPAHVLVVDDDVTILELAGQAFEPLGHIVTCARNGDDAIALAQVMQPDVILMDLIMPGLSGDDAIEMLKSDPGTRAIPVIAMSASPDLVQTALRTNADGILPKPF